MRTVRIVLWALVACLGVVTGWVALMQAYGVLNPPPPVVEVGKAAIAGPFELLTLAGKPFSNADLVGKPYLVFFGFTHCPDICPTTLYELTSLLAELGTGADRLMPLFITVDPERDTADQLAFYMSEFDPRIVALRGTPAQTASAAKAFAAYFKKIPEDGGDYTMEHTAGIILMDARGEFAGKLDMHEPRDIQLKKLQRLIAPIT